LLNTRVKENPDAQLLFIGDSITQGWEGEGKEVWAKYFMPLKAINLGIGGDRTQHVLYRLDNGNLEGIQPKAAVVMIGTNNSNGEDNTPGQIADGVRAIVERLRDRIPGVKILLLAIFPRGENYNPQRGKVAQINQVLQKLDDGKQVFFLDIGHRFLTEDGLIPGEIMPDYLHLTPKGYEIWAQAITPWVKKALGETKATAAAGDPSGDWILKMRGPNDQEVEMPMTLKATGEKLAGRVARGPDRWLEISEGRIQSGQLSFSIRRDRDQNSPMVYKMEAKLAGDSLEGTATTEMDGAPITVKWIAQKAKTNQAATAPAEFDPTGEWILKMAGPNSHEVDLAMSLKAEGGKLTGKVARGQLTDRKIRGTDIVMEITEGKVTGQQLSFVIKHHDDQEGWLVYHMRAKWAGGQLAGQATTEKGGKEITTEWTATKAQPQKPVAAPTHFDPTGEWILKMAGPNSHEVDLAMSLKAEGGKLTGKVARGQLTDRKIRGTDIVMEITEGKINGQQLSFVIKHHDDQAGWIVYRMEAKPVGEQLAGTAKTERAGKEVTTEWTAVRSKP
jgi:beta-glucosidase